MQVDLDWEYGIEKDDLNFYNSSVNIIDSNIKLWEARFYRSNLTADGNSSVFLSQGGEAIGIATFLRSSIVKTN